MTASSHQFITTAGMGPSTEAPAAWDVGALNMRLSAVRDAADQAAALQEIAGVLAEAIRPVGLFWFDPASDPTAGAPVGLLFPVDGVAESTQELLRSLAQAVRETRATQSAPVTVESGTIGVAVSVDACRKGVGCLIALVESSQVSSATVVEVLELGALHLSVRFSAVETERLNTQLDSAAALAELTARLESVDSLAAATRLLARTVREYLDCDRVFVGLAKKGQSQCEFVADSADNPAPSGSDLAREIEATLHEAALRTEPAIWPPSDSRPTGLLTHRQLAGTMDAATVVSGALRDAAGDLQGAWILLGDTGLGSDAARINFIRAAEQVVGSSLKLLRRSEPGRLQRLVEPTREGFSNHARGLLMGGALLLGGLCMIPMPYKVKCDCEMQPVMRRYVAAPFAGPLDAALVEPGELVGKGQVLARIDGREIRWKLAESIAERERAAKQRDVNMVTQELGAAEVARQEMERHAVRTRMLEDRSRHLDIVSPIDGLVITGDWKKAAGTPLEQGQSLFEIAPLDEMVVEVAIPEDDIQYTQVGQAVRVRLDSFPHESFDGTIERIHPSAETKHQQQVFIAEMTLRNPDDLLRPGMQGRAKVTTDKHPFAWNVLHKPWERLTSWISY